MKQSQTIMGMPATVEIVDQNATSETFEKVFSYFKYVDEKFSTYKQDSEISAINNGKIKKRDYSADMKTVLTLCEKTKTETNGYFDIKRSGKLDPSGLVKGWSIYNAAEILKKDGFKNFFVEIGGDIQVSGKNSSGKSWAVGIRNPFNLKEIIKVVEVSSEGVATSGTYERGQHVYNPKSKSEITKIVSLTVIGPNIYEADRFATAAFAMEEKGIMFIENLAGFEGYLIDNKGMATYTSNFEKYIQK